jgi:hypothetical protein
MASSASPAAKGVQAIALSTCSTAALCLSTEPLHNDHRPGKCMLVNKRLSVGGSALVYSILTCMSCKNYKLYCRKTSFSLMER